MELLIHPKGTSEIQFYTSYIHQVKTFATKFVVALLLHQCLDFTLSLLFCYGSKQVPKIKVVTIKRCSYHLPS